MFKTQCALSLIALYVGLAHSWDIAVSMGDQLLFYTNATKTETVRINSQNLWALAYDNVHNMLLYIDKENNNDAIGGINLSTMEYKYIIKRNGRNILGLAFDPATELLFFSDSNEKSINWVSLKPGANDNFNGNLLIKMDDGVPTDLAVDSCRGYIYWMNTNRMKPRIARARFDGSDRKIVVKLTSMSINTPYKMEPHSLTIDQQTQRMFWLQPVKNLQYNTYGTDLNGKNKRRLDIPFHFVSYEKIFTNPSNIITVSNTSLIFWDWITAISTSVYEEAKDGAYVKKLFSIETDTPIGIAANYKISDQVRGLTNCDALTSLVQNISVTNNSLNITKEYEGPFCVNGKKGNGQSRCQCTPGYIGERCDVSVFMNLQGTDSINEEGPICSCNEGYSGERCDFNSCQDYCLNNGDCQLNNKSEPVCRCKGSYVGDRCEVSTCLNYCIQGTCSFNEEGLPTCSCEAGYSGKRCEVDACHSYCMNDGDCSLDEEGGPVCQCGDNHVGSRCEAVNADLYGCFKSVNKYEDYDYDGNKCYFLRNI